MNDFDIHSLITTVDNLIFSYTGENLDDVQSEIVEGVINHQKYTEIAKNHHRSEKYVKDVAGKLWKTLSEILEEEVNGSSGLGMVRCGGINRLNPYLARDLID